MLASLQSEEENVNNSSMEKDVWLRSKILNGSWVEVFPNPILLWNIQICTLSSSTKFNQVNTVSHFFKAQPTQTEHKVVYVSHKATGIIGRRYN